MLPQVNRELMSKQLRDILLAEMRRGVFKGSKKLPSEEEMTKIFNVSRSVIRDTMLDMEKDGFVLRIRGIGTIINHHVLDVKVRLDWEIDYHSILHEMGIQDIALRARMSIIEADWTLSDKLGVTINEEMILCEKTVYADKTPAMFFTDCYAKSFLSGADTDAIDWDVSTFTILGQYSQTFIILSLTHVEAVGADSHLMEIFGVQEKTPLLFLDGIGYSRAGKPIVQSKVYYRNGMFDFTILRKKH